MVLQWRTNLVLHCGTTRVQECVLVGKMILHWRTNLVLHCGTKVFQGGSPLFPIVVQWSKIGALTELYILETLILISDSEIHCCCAVAEKDELCEMFEIRCVNLQRYSSTPSGKKIL